MSIFKKIKDWIFGENKGVYSTLKSIVSRIFNESVDNIFERIRSNIPVSGYYKLSDSIEVIDIIEKWGLNYHLSSFLKHILVCDKKEDLLGELKKAFWYLDRYLNTFKGSKKKIELKDSKYSIEIVLDALKLAPIIVEILTLFYNGYYDKVLILLGRLIVLLEEVGKDNELAKSVLWSTFDSRDKLILASEIMYKKDFMA